MSDLLEYVLAEHGGRERWQSVRTLEVHVSVGGGMWQLKGWAGALADARFSIDAQTQHVEFTRATEPDRRSIYEPGRTATVTEGGELVEQRESPRDAFNGHVRATPWDAQQLIYFAGYAMWTYLTTPFLLVLPGVRTDEIEPWSGEGEVWRRLKVVFPSSIHSHSREQTFYFDSSGLLRRQDYSVDIMGGTSSAHYASDHERFSGLIFPTRRRVFAIGEGNLPLRDRVGVSIDILDLEVRR